MADEYNPWAPSYMDRKKSAPISSSQYEKAVEWLEAESSGSEGKTTDEIETIRTLLQRAIAGANEPGE